VAIKTADEREAKMPDVGLIKLLDAESGETIWVDTSDNMIRKKYFDHYVKRELMLKDAFSKAGVDVISIKTNMDYIKPLINFFKKRKAR